MWNSSSSLAAPLTSPCCLSYERLEQRFESFSTIYLDIRFTKGIIQHFSLYSGCMVALRVHFGAMPTRSNVVKSNLFLKTSNAFTWGGTDRVEWSGVYVVVCHMYPAVFGWAATLQHGHVIHLTLHSLESWNRNICLVRVIAERRCALWDSMTVTQVHCWVQRDCLQLVGCIVCDTQVTNLRVSDYGSRPNVFCLVPAMLV